MLYSIELSFLRVQIHLNMAIQLLGTLLGKLHYFALMMQLVGLRGMKALYLGFVRDH